MAPFSGNSGGTPASSAAHASAEKSGLTPESGSGEDALDQAPAEERNETAASEAGEADASVPAGEPEAPVGPVEPAFEESDQPPAEQEEQVERDLDELTARAEKADEYLELAKRTRADFENYRKRAARDAAAAQERGVVKLVKELLPAVDNLDRAVDAVAANGEPADELVAGIKLVHAEVVAALGRAGVELYSPAGERFDPTRHEAVAQQPVEGAEPGTVVEVYQRGCRLGDSVIRPARVVVAG